MTLAAFATVALIHLLAAISPGPSFVVSVRTAIAEGFPTATALALGFGIGAAVWAAAALAGLALLFELVPALYLSLKLVGAAFLLYIAVSMWRHAPKPLPAADARPPRGTLAAMRLGILTFITNPKAAIFFGAIFVGLVPAGTSLPWLAALVAIVFFNETLWYIVVARVFSLPRARAAYGRAKSWIDRSLGTLLAAFGLKVALT
ncbi:LysE family translocator [Poseidonocella sedimentorum]|uniref:Threonine/homoserine/homoserine lactone efflux protein n=1 Tax=Poseidonocella sedimentorum TaxID=871652 RepID=A0A1I6DF73_9RHOB|nr:LysE family transporter [Poseidonocella sedimentorum]SFR04109.1 Threonine/homoserine/homoserine lactone efflux protein [Poseidonocella sedimentorum]